MELFRPAGLLTTDASSQDWTREHGYAQTSEFPFPDLYLDPRWPSWPRKTLPWSPSSTNAWKTL